jgi:cell wall-associated NlpC family hydrolase
MLPGDIVFFNNGYNEPQPGHVGIYIGNQEVIDAYNDGVPVQITPLATGSRHEGKIMGVRRF